MKHDIAESYRGFYGGFCQRAPDLVFNIDPAKADVDYLTHVDLEYTNVPWHGKPDFLEREQPQLDMDVDAADEWIALMYGPEYQDEHFETPGMETIPGDAKKKATSVFG